MKGRSWIHIPTLEGGPVTRRDIDAFKQLQKTMNGIGNDVKKEMRDLAKGLMKPAAQNARERATMKLQRQVVKSVKPEFFKGFPAITAGGSKMLNLSNGRGGTHQVMAGEVFAGAEFGSKGSRNAGHYNRHGNWKRNKGKTASVAQFPPRTAKLGRGNVGYFFYPALRAKVDQAALLKSYFKTVGQIFKRHGV